MEYDIYQVVNMKNRYLELKKYLDKIVFVKRDKKDVLDVTSLNRWLIEVMKFYKKCGINLDYRDFYNFHKDNISDYKNRNDKINKYMKVFFDNIDRPDSEEFINTIFSFKDISLDNDNDIVNPIYEEIVVMINNLNNKYKNIFDRILIKLEKDYRDLGLDKELFSYQRMDELDNIVNSRINITLNKINSMLLEQEKANKKR